MAGVDLRAAQTTDTPTGSEYLRKRMKQSCGAVCYPLTLIWLAYGTTIRFFQVTDMGQSHRQPFWERKRLDQMSRDEWEALCDGCGKCCLHKLEDVDSGRILYTNVACRLLDAHSCRCSRYAQRQEYVSDCLTLTPQRIRQLSWLPRSCAYRRLAEGRGLAWWHPLVSGDPETVHRAGISVRGRTVPEAKVDLSELEDYLAVDSGMDIDCTAD